MKIFESIFESTVTTNILLVIYVAWHLFVKKVVDAYNSRKGHNIAEKEDIGELESLKSAGRQPFDIDLEKQKAQVAYVLEEFKESLKIRIETKRKLYEGLVKLKVYIRHIYYRSESEKEMQDAFDKFKVALDEVSDYMSCNKHFVNEIDPGIIAGFEGKTNFYLGRIRAVNSSVINGVADRKLIDERDASATELLDDIDTCLEKIFKINPAELPYNKAI